MSLLGLFERALGENRSIEVAMGAVGHVVFGPNQTSIGTRSLAGCSVALIVSEKAAILAHIPPRPAHAAPDDLEAGDRNAAHMMNKVATLFLQLQHHFEKQSQSVVICAVFQVGEQAILKDQQSIIRNVLNKMGLMVYEANYTAGGFSKSNVPGKGTVFVDASKGTPAIYIEDELFNPGIVGQVPPSAPQQSSQPSSSNPFLGTPQKIWSSKDLRFYTIDSQGQVEWEDRQYRLDASLNKLYFTNPRGQSEWMDKNDESLIYGNIQSGSQEQTTSSQPSALPKAPGTAYFDDQRQRWYVSDKQGKVQWIDKIALSEGVFFDEKRGRFYHVRDSETHWLME